MEVILGDKIGEGNRRIVYNHAERDDLVVKVLKNEVKSNDDHNRIEYNNWIKLKDDKWLAPCLFLSECEQYLIQLKGELAPIPKEVPDFIKKQRDWNLGRGQWVKINNNIVLCDYGFYEI